MSSSVRITESFTAVFRDVTQRSPERNFLSGERCVTSRKTAAKETIHYSLFTALLEDAILRGFNSDKTGISYEKSPDSRY